MNSLKIKFIGLVALILVLAIGMTIWRNLGTQRAILEQAATQNARILGDVVRNSIITYMANAQNSEVGQILEKIRREPSIDAVRIFDETGRILISATTEETGDLVPAPVLVAFRSGKTLFTEENEGGSYRSALVPIYNAPNCHSCHAADKQILGVLNLRLSLNGMKAIQNEGREATLFSSLAVLLVLVLTISLFILHYVDTPIRKIAEAMTRVEKGDLEAPALEINSSEEMALFATKFSKMVEHLRSLLDSKLQHEREMAVAREKLAHHDEISSMNTTLEERLKEIEYLNITLEERIEEIEEANYKIADLASDLEAKNTNLTNAVGRLSALYKMGLAINSTMDLQQLFDLLLRKTADALNAQVGYLLLLDRESGSLQVGAISDSPESVDLSQDIPLRPGGVSYWVIENKQSLLIKDMKSTREFSRISRLGFQRESVICAPLVIKDEVIGTVTMNNRHDGSFFGAEDLELLSTIAAQASIAIKNARFYEEQQTTYLSTVQALVSAIEASDAYTRGHSERVTRYSLLLARHMGLSAGSIKNLEQAAILHDIGKIGIDSSLLHKPDELSGGDVDILRQHPSIGVRILEPIHFLKDVRAIIEQHHERFDGTGYPLGISGKELLPEARILAVADTFDAMTSDRPYRKSLTCETALKEITANAGSQFDPEVVNAFVKLWRQGILPEDASGAA